MKRALFIGRWQPLHPGHKWLFNQKLDQDIPILIAVRDTPIDDSNPFTTDDVISNLEKEYSKEVESGITIHFVNKNYDEGEVILQKKCAVSVREGVGGLKKKIRALEFEYFPKTIEKLLLQ